MNGYVLAWMALSGSGCGAVGVFAGRKFEWHKIYRMGFEAGEQLGYAEARRKEQSEKLADAQVERWQRLMAGLPVDDEGPIGPHGHPGPCSQARSCW